MPTFTSAGWRSARDARKAKKAGSTRVEPAASVEGTWNVVVKSPAGPMPTTLLLERVNGELTGSQSGQGMTTPITDVKVDGNNRSEEHTSELQSLMRISYAVFCLKKKKKTLQ